MKFKYSAKKPDGTEYEREAEAADRFALFREIKKEGDTVISVREVRAGHAFSFSARRVMRFASGVRTHEKIMFARNLGAMLEAGLSVSRALGVLERQMRNPRFQDIFARLNSDIASGSAFSDALEKFPGVFPRLFIAMARAGEGSGKLSEALRVIAGQMEQSYELRKKIRGAMTYPGVILGAMVIIGFLMMTYVVPTLSSTFASLNVSLPASTQLIISVSDFLAEYTLVAIALLAATVVALILFFRTALGHDLAGWVLVRVPVVSGIMKETNAARVARTLSSLLAAGVPVVEALAITSDVVQNRAFRGVLTAAQDAVVRGEPLSEIFRASENLYPPFVVEMISVGEETGDLSGMLIRVAVFYEEEVGQKTKNLSTIIEPLLMVIIGAAVGFFAVSMISPIYSISESI